MARLPEYIGPQMRPWVDRIFRKPIVYLGCTRQFSNSNWKLYLENVKDPYHASLLHLFHTTFNIFRVNMQAHHRVRRRPACTACCLAIKQDDTDAAELQGPEHPFLRRRLPAGGRVAARAGARNMPRVATNHIQPIFPQLVIQQIHNTLVARQLLPKGPDQFELVFHFFGYEDDTPELRALRIKQANLVGPAGYISMEDTEATELVQRGHRRAMAPRVSVLEMSRSAPDEQADADHRGLGAPVLGRVPEADGLRRRACHAA